jgi:hypothetical protein
MPEGLTEELSDRTPPLSLIIRWSFPCGLFIKSVLGLLLGMGTVAGGAYLLRRYVGGGIDVIFAAAAGGFMLALWVAFQACCWFIRRCGRDRGVVFFFPVGRDVFFSSSSGYRVPGMLMLHLEWGLLGVKLGVMIVPPRTFPSPPVLLA